MSDDPVFTVKEAAAYCGVTRQGVEAAIRAASLSWVEIHVTGGRGPRVVKGVHKSTLDTFRAHGFLKPAKRKKGGRKPGRARRANIII